MERRQEELRLEACLFEVSDLYGNTVSLSLERWQYIQKHPEMCGQEEAVRKALQEPTVISMSSDSDQRFIFDRHHPSAQRSNIVRVVVEYDSCEIQKGSSTGDVITAYGPLKSNTGSIGSMIYFSGLTRRSQ